MASRTIYNCDICGAEYQLPNGEDPRRICKFKDTSVYISSMRFDGYTDEYAYVKRLDICSNCCKALKETLLTLKENNLGCDITVDMEED